MRKIIVLEHVSMDGVIQAPGGRDEDPSGGFKYGGWSAPYQDNVLGAAVKSVWTRRVTCCSDARRSRSGKVTGRSIRTHGRA